MAHVRGNPGFRAAFLTRLVPWETVPAAFPIQTPGSAGEWAIPLRRSLRGSGRRLRPPARCGGGADASCTMAPPTHATDGAKGGSNGTRSRQPRFLRSLPHAAGAAGDCARHLSGTDSRKCWLSAPLLAGLRPASPPVAHDSGLPLAAVAAQMHRFRWLRPLCRRWRQLRLQWHTFAATQVSAQPS